MPTTAATPDAKSPDAGNPASFNQGPRSSAGPGIIDFAGLAAALLDRSGELLPAWFPAGELNGHEYQVGSVRGEAGNSLSINVNTGKWADFAEDVKGGDLISLYAACQAIKQSEAATRLAQDIGFNLCPNAVPNRSTNDNGANPKPAVVKPPVGTPPPSMRHFERGEPSRSWCYRDAAGEPLFYVARYETPTPKDPGAKVFIPWSWDRSSAGWAAKAWPAPRPLYGLDLLAQRPDASVLIVEGEKAAEAAKTIIGGVYVVVSWPNGAQAVDKADWSPLRGRNVLVWPDADEAGIAAGQQIAAKLAPVCPEVKVIDVPIGDTLPSGYDAADAVEDGWSLETFEAWSAPRTKVVARTPAGSDDTTKDADALSSHISLISQAKETPFPDDLNDEALYGLTGEVVKAIEPHSEADPAALAINLLAGFSGVIGAGPHFKVEGDTHSLRVSAILVGNSAKGRKGTSWGPVRSILSSADEPWTKERILSGLSSGEGLIWQVRDQITKQEPIREGKEISRYQEVIVDPGIADKRLLVIEPEFARTLKVMSREGNVLSAIIRQAWDSGDLRVLTKNSPCTATGAHIVILGHVTRNELLRYLDSTEAASGFGNRFIWMAVKRSKCLPEGGSLSSEALAAFGAKLAEVVEFSKTVGLMTRDEDARAIWWKVYPSLSGEKAGMYGALVSRAEAQVMRLSCLYALLDSSHVVKAVHMTAALALWDRAEASARFIFGDKLGDSIADTILDSLRSRGELNQTAISALFNRHVPTNRIASALAALVKAGLATSMSRPTGGRSETIWRPV